MQLTVPASPTHFYLGLDLGQSQDPTALAILEKADVQGEFDYMYHAFKKLISLRIRYLERMPLGTPYTEIVDRVRDITRSSDLMGRCTLMVDATGVGRPVVDMLRKADLGCKMLPVVVSSGYTETLTDSFYHVPKHDLIVGLQVLLQQKALQIASGLQYGAALIEEMMAMKVKITPAGHEQFAAWRDGEHDDLVFAVALAFWGAKKADPHIASQDAYFAGDPARIQGRIR